MSSNAGNPAFTRRTFFRAAAVAGAALACSSQRIVVAEAEGRQRYDGLNTDKYLGKVDVLAKVEDTKVFTEGPAADRDGNVFFTNVAASKILRWEPKAKRLSVFREGTNETNGLAFDPQGRLLACEGKASRVTRTDMKTGRIEVLADKYDGLPLAPPNDVCLDGQGRIYFSSRPGLPDPNAKGKAQPKTNVNAVYRIDARRPGKDGKYPVEQLLRWPDVHMPNGLVTSPDNKVLYLIEAHADAKHHRDIRAFDLADGKLSNERVLIDFYPGRSGDGMRIDAEGNLYVAAGLHKTRGTSETLDTRPGIHVISPQGKLLAFRETPEDTITNCAFGGEDLRTLYVTCGTLLLSIRTEIPGKPRYRPNA